MPESLHRRHGALAKLARGIIVMCLNLRVVRFRHRKESVAEGQSWCRDVLGEVGIAVVRKITTVLQAGMQPCRHLLFGHKNSLFTKKCEKPLTFAVGANPNVDFPATSRIIL